MIKNYFKVKSFDDKIKLYKPSKNIDNRGEIWTTYKDKYFKKKYNHDKLTLAYKNTLRGMHADKKMWKLITCVYGESYCVIVNYNFRSKYFLKKYTFTLNNINNYIIEIPPNMLLGWCCLSKECIFSYKFSYRDEYIDDNEQFTIKWNDKRLKIKWPITKPILSKRDNILAKNI